MRVIPSIQMSVVRGHLSGYTVTMTTDANIMPEPDPHLEVVKPGEPPLEDSELPEEAEAQEEEDRQKAEDAATEAF